jgi:thiol:disulfide interchange protein DsbA
MRKVIKRNLGAFMNRRLAVLSGLLALSLACASDAATEWKEGKHYIPVTPQRTSVPAGKVEVAEVFSYGCPYCYQIQPVIRKLAAELPPNAQLVYLPASFLPREAWPMYQRSFYAAQALGIMERTHDAVFEAVWKTGELSYTDPRTRRIKNPLPTIEDAAKVYARLGGVTPEAFLKASKSFSVDSKMRAADAIVNGTGSLSTPSFLVNGKYRLDAGTAGGYDEAIELIKYLVAKESATKGAPAKAASAGVQK